MCHISPNNYKVSTHPIKFSFSGANCTDCVADWYNTNCSVYCVEIPDQYTCNSTTGDKVCEGHWTGSECDSCETNYYGTNCDTFCQTSTAWNCSSTGDKICTGKRTGTRYNSDLDRKRSTHVIYLNLNERPPSRNKGLNLG